MSQENVEVVKVAYEAFARGGLERFMEHFTDDVEYHAPIHGDYVTNKQFLDSLIFMTQFLPGSKSTN